MPDATLIYEYKYAPYSSDNGPWVVNVTDDMKYYRMQDENRDTYLVDINSGEKHPIRSYEAMNSNGTTYASYSYESFRDDEQVFRVEVSSIDSGDLLYTSPTIQYSEDNPTWLIYLADMYLIFSEWLEQSDHPDLANYFKLDFDTNKVSYMFSSHISGKISPDGKYFIYSPFDYHSELEIDGKERGFYIYEVQSGKTAFYSTGKIYEGFGGSNEIICWTNKEALDGLLKGK